VATLAAGMSQAVPLVRTLGIRFTDLAENGAEVSAQLPDREDLHNHVGGPHAGVLFSLGETVSGGVVLSAFADQLADTVPLAVGARIAYRKLAMGTVSATARLATSKEDVLAELEAGNRPEFDVAVEIANAEGVVTAEMTVTWTLRRRQRG
jgi:acyl-coenzyme A thioesterase PaaI-like protein